MNTFLLKEDFSDQFSGWSVSTARELTNGEKVIFLSASQPSSVTKTFNFPYHENETVSFEAVVYAFDSWDNNSSNGYDHIIADIGDYHVDMHPDNFENVESVGMDLTGYSWNCYRKVTIKGEASLDSSGNITAYFKCGANQSYNDESMGLLSIAFYGMNTVYPKNVVNSAFTDPDMKVKYYGKSYHQSRRQRSGEMCLSCKEWRELGHDTSGIYEIDLNGRVTKVYCDMVTDGGGWTLAVGPRLKLGKTDPFWEGNSELSQDITYDGYTINTQDLQAVIKDFDFEEMMMHRGSPIIYRSAELSKFPKKRINKTTWTKISGDNYPTMVWDYSDRDGYTHADFVMAARINTSTSYGDYNEFGIGATAWSSTSLWTAFNYLGAAVNYSTSLHGSYGIGNVYHRGASEGEDYGMFFR